MTDRKPLEELFDFPTSGEPPPAGDTDVETAQQDLLFDDEAGPLQGRPASTHELDGAAPEEMAWQPEMDGSAAGEAEPGEVDDAPSLADRWLSGAADALLLCAVLCVALLTMLPLGLTPAMDQWPGFALFLASFSFLFCTFPLAFWGQTPGMAWRGLRAINEDGLSLSFSQTTLRWLGGAVSLLLLGLPLVVALWGRSLADRLSGSWTVRI